MFWGSKISHLQIFKHDLTDTYSFSTIIHNMKFLTNMENTWKVPFSVHVSLWMGVVTCQLCRVAEVVDALLTGQLQQLITHQGCMLTNYTVMLMVCRRTIIETIITDTGQEWLIPVPSHSSPYHMWGCMCDISDRAWCISIGKTTVKHNIWSRKCFGDVIMNRAFWIGESSCDLGHGWSRHGHIDTATRASQITKLQDQGSHNMTPWHDLHG